MIVSNIELKNSSFVKDYFIGDWYYHNHPPFSYEENPAIFNNQVQLTRHDEGPYYNMAQESFPGLGPHQPAGTEWNFDGWDDLSNITNRDYSYQLNSSHVGLKLVMHDITNDWYYIVEFLSFGSDNFFNNGGAFSVRWRRINVTVFFNKPGSNDNNDISLMDFVDENLTIARDKGNIYNSQKETKVNDKHSPSGTLWNSDGWFDLSNITERNYTTFKDLIKNIDENLVSRELVMWDISNNNYYAIKFLSWDNSNDLQFPGFSYERRLINTKKLERGIKFADGTRQITAFTEDKLGIIPQSNIPITQNCRYLQKNDIGKHIVVKNPKQKIFLTERGNHEEFPIGSIITIVNLSGDDITVGSVSKFGDVILISAGTDTTSKTWILPTTGIATLIKVDQVYNNKTIETWLISGTGIRSLEI